MANLKSRLTPGPSFVYLYGTTPPRAGATPDLVNSAAAKLHARLLDLPLDGLVIYDVQDESGRTAQQRPFPYLPTMDSRLYARTLTELAGLEAVTYKCVCAENEASWNGWLDQTAEWGLDPISLVGRATSRNPGTEATPALTLPLGRATELAVAHPHGFTLGGVAIAERHRPESPESTRMLRKIHSGIQFFISQAVYSPHTSIAFLRDYAAECEAAGIPPRRVVLTFTPCGREKTLAFIRWLGIAIEDQTAAAILAAPRPVTKSIDFCCQALAAILEDPVCHALPLGVNVESVSIVKEEIDGSVDLFWRLREVVQRHR